LHHGNELELKRCAENDCSLCAQLVMGFDRLTNYGQLTSYKYKNKGAKITGGLALLRIGDVGLHGDYYDKDPLKLSLWIPSTARDYDFAYYVDLSLSPKQG
jgi:hypothetical protein